MMMNSCMLKLWTFASVLMVLALAPSCKKGGGAAKDSVGIACAADSDCSKGLFCQVRLPGGMCTKECSPCPAACSADCEAGCDKDEAVKCIKGCVEVNDVLCPEGSQCAGVAYTVSGQSFNDVRCLPECDLERPCRSGYQCARPEGFDFSVCIPG